MVAEYGTIGNSLAAQFLYGLTTSAGVIALTVAMVGGVLAAVVAMLIGFHGAAVWIGLVAGLVVLGGLFAYAAVMVPREQARLIARFPTPATEPATDQPM